MSRYYGHITGGRAVVTRCGHRTQGLTASVNMHGAGVEIQASYEWAYAGDGVTIFATKGYNREKRPVLRLSRTQLERLASGTLELALVQRADNE